MPYVLEKLTDSDRKKILHDSVCDAKKLKHLLARGGYFHEHDGLSWAINNEKDSYLLLAPKFDVMASYNPYFFFYNGYLYKLTLVSVEKRILRFEENMKSGSFPSELKDEIKEAFRVHGIYGMDPKCPSEFSFMENEK